MLYGNLSERTNVVLDSMPRQCQATTEMLDQECTESTRRMIENGTRVSQSKDTITKSEEGQASLLGKRKINQR